MEAATSILKRHPHHSWKATIVWLDVVNLLKRDVLHERKTNADHEEICKTHIEYQRVYKKKQSMKHRNASFTSSRQSKYPVPCPTFRYQTQAR